ncbi:hypothetical protein [Limnochorda pilosa]|uniref:Uncharacterized protein n=1 Tax=Limnochorda pilosa TaxID=1555112 RepID=A0A0K2SI45_LIMPI|nr:hypothetical protein [Limnochorda pilosa]BAS26755.1 hypothetical protein LIP_0898 [Limnochorda pilosa]
MSAIQAPPGWGRDSLTSFLDDSRGNCFATYVKLRSEYVKLLEIDGLFSALIASLNDTPDWFAALFVQRSHSAYRAACHLGMAGQVVESYALQRLCLEHALYGHYGARDLTLQETWLRRDESDKARTRVRNTFRMKKLLDSLANASPRLADAVSLLYERCIDYGAHPNQQALLQSTSMQVDEASMELHLGYLLNDPLVLRFGLRSAAQVGVSSLGVFELVFDERFRLLGLDDQLRRARQGL